jgi:predicted deacylase
MDERKPTPVAQVIHDPADIDFARPGKHHYEVAFARDGTYDKVLVPLTVINGARGAGQTIAGFGGTHGNEYEGQVVMRRLAHDLSPDKLAGRVILVPRLNPPAAEACRRESPVDGGNMNRIFPGNPEGTVSASIAWFVSQRLFPLADVVIDLHSAGAQLEHLLMTSFHLVDDPRQRATTMTLAALFDPPMLLAYSGNLAAGTLTECAERLGKIAIGSELGHLAGVVQTGVRHGYEGFLNVLRYCKLLDGEIVKIDPSRTEPPVLARWLSWKETVTAPFTGVFECRVAVGGRVRQGQVLGYLYDFQHIESRPLEIVAPVGGILIAQHFKAPVERGATVIIVATEITDRELTDLVARETRERVGWMPTTVRER